MSACKFTPVILSGGSGSRLWPLSRALRPKQFLGIVDEKTMFQHTLARLRGLADPISPIVIANNDHRFLVAEQCKEYGVSPKALLLEPVARNTAPAIAAACFVARTEDDDPIMLVLPSDHSITNMHAFQQAVVDGYQAAREGALVVFGIKPTHPETGYGYVRAAGEDLSVSTCSALKVEAFIEKPSLEKASQCLADGGYFWNSGMYMFRASLYLEELQKFDSAMYLAVENSVITAQRDLDFLRLNSDYFAGIISNSIDYAVMEKTNKAVVISLDAGWSDVGEWSSVWRILPHDVQGNAIRGDVLLESVDGCYVHADHRLVCMLGVKDIVVVETSDAVLVVHKDQTQSVKSLVEKLNAGNRLEVLNHRKVFRPWGYYESIDKGLRYQVKRITVNPGAKLSLQMHHHRAEHWVVVSGTAKVVLDNKEMLLSENESIYIPVGAKHALENPGKFDLELIEVQSGSYLGEDDIVRFEDIYGRV